MGVVDFFRQLCCFKAAAQQDEEPALPPRPYHCPRTAAKPFGSGAKRAEDAFAWRLYEQSGRVHYNPKDEEGTIRRLYQSFYDMRPTSSRRRAREVWWADMKDIPEVDQIGNTRPYCA